ncbi:hypothetical protein Golob_002257 [Gossypium lobatum]|uniref:Uncharacterized protein n=1 Tax=Gossypium lobatum TaxID=34289 RepID=A0A7J8N4F5_9ROSI|nr:hypothetical protein [Gossypium lobatum]
MAFSFRAMLFLMATLLSSLFFFRLNPVRRKRRLR